MKHERANDRKIAAVLKEGPGDRRVHFTLASPAAGLTWMHGQARHNVGLSGKVFCLTGTAGGGSRKPQRSAATSLWHTGTPATGMTQAPDNQRLFMKVR